LAAALGLAGLAAGLSEEATGFSATFGAASGLALACRTEGFGSDLASLLASLGGAAASGFFAAARDFLPRDRVVCFSESAASAAIDHVRDWVHGTPEGDWVSMGVCSDGSYDVEEGLISGFPCTCAGGEWSIVEGLDIDDFSRERIDATVNELKDERDTVNRLALI